MVKRKNIKKATVLIGYTAATAVAVSGVDRVCTSAHAAINGCIDAAPIDGRVKTAAKAGVTVARIAAEWSTDMAVVSGLNRRCNEDLRRVDRSF